MSFHSISSIASWLVVAFPSWQNRSGHAAALQRAQSFFLEDFPAQLFFYTVQQYIAVYAEVQMSWTAKGGLTDIIFSRELTDIFFSEGVDRYLTLVKR